MGIEKEMWSATVPDVVAHEGIAVMRVVAGEEGDHSEGGVGGGGSGAVTARAAADRGIV